MTTARRYGGSDAAAVGLVDAAVSESELFDEAVRRGQALAPKAGATLGLIKAGLYRRPAETLRRGGRPPARYGRRPGSAEEPAAASTWAADPGASETEFAGSAQEVIECPVGCARRSGDSEVEVERAAEGLVEDIGDQAGQCGLFRRPGAESRSRWVWSGGP